jgi:hypothetical protein
MAGGFNEQNTISLTALDTFAHGQRVKISTGGAAAVAAAADAAKVIGTVVYHGASAATVGRDTIAVLRKSSGIHPAIASGAITAGTEIKGDDGGKVQFANGSNPEGVALESATSDGQFISVLYY